MTGKIITLRGEQVQNLHNQIIKDYCSLLDFNNGKEKNKILEQIAKKYGYSSGQSIRNILNKNKKASMLMFDSK